MEYNANSMMYACANNYWAFVCKIHQSIKKKSFRVNNYLCGANVNNQYLNVNLNDNCSIAKRHFCLIFTSFV